MQVVLKTSVEHLGQAGEIKTVKSGYARNYLLPHGLAVPATSATLVQAAAQKKKLEQQEIQRQESLRNVAASLKDQTITIKAKANDEGHLFGSVDRADIVRALAERELKEVTPEAIDLPTPLKTLGTVTVHLVVGTDRIPFYVAVTKE
jgi:large subunit ribosomal protein L9